jgi:hypothetical protein
VIEISTVWVGDERKKRVAGSFRLSNRWSSVIVICKEGNATFCGFEDVLGALLDGKRCRMAGRAGGGCCLCAELDGVRL